MSPWSVRSRGVSVAPRVAHRREGRDDQGQRRRHLAPAAVRVLPDGLHAHRVLAHRNRDPQARAERHADRLYGLIEPSILAGVSGGGHPVG